MALIKQKDVKSYFADRKAKLSFRVLPQSLSDATQVAMADRISADNVGAGVDELPETTSFLPDVPAAPMMRRQNSGLTLVPNAKKVSEA